MIGPRNDSGMKSFPVSAAIAKATLVKLDSDGDISVAALNEKAIGITRTQTFAAGETTTVDLTTKSGTVTCTAAGAFAAGAVVYGRAAGEVDDIATGAIAIGVAMEAATAQGDLVEVMLTD